MRQIKEQKGNKHMKESGTESNVKESDVRNFVVNYADGTQKTFEKGFLCEIKEENGEDTMTFTMSHCSGADLAKIIFGCIELGAQIGLFDKNATEHAENQE